MAESFVNVSKQNSPKFKVSRTVPKTAIGKLFLPLQQWQSGTLYFPFCTTTQLTRGLSAATSNRNLPQQLTLDHVSPATRLLEKRRHMFEVQEALDAQKEGVLLTIHFNTHTQTPFPPSRAEEFQRREATFQRREEMLKKKDLELQESLIKFHKFLQENDSKRNRAEKKQLDEKKQKHIKEAEIIRLHGEVEKQKEKRGQMMEEVKKMSQYQGFLDSVLEVEEEYPEIADLLARYETLSAARADLIKRQDSAADQNERERKELQEFMQVQTDKILNYNNQIADLQDESEKAVEKVVEIQYVAERQVASVADSTLELGQVMMACENIYQRCMSKTYNVRKEVKAKTGDGADGSGEDRLNEETKAVVTKLGHIRDYITDLQAIVKNAKPVTTPNQGGGSGAPSDQAATTAVAVGTRAAGVDSKVAYYQAQVADARQSARGAPTQPAARSSRSGSGTES